MLNQEAAHFGCFHGPTTSDTPSHPLTHSSFFCKHPIRLRPGDNICQMPPPSRFADREERLATEGREKYQGTARIKLEVLHFPQNEPRELDRKNVERLKGYFKKGQCHRVGRNHIPAVIDQSQLSEVLRDSNVSVKTLLSNTDPHPMLRFPAGSQLQCLHGRHRIQAAREFLTPRESWWTVDLYLSGTCHHSSRRYH